MIINFKNCNNIDSGSVEIFENRLNIKYAINGTGKSTIAKALLYKITADEDGLKNLIPFKHYPPEETEHFPDVSGAEEIQNITIFDEDYVDQYIFKPDELVENSFEIFVKTQNYDNQMKEIEILVKEIKDFFQINPEIDELIRDMNTFIDSFGRAQSGYSKASALGKGLGEGNKIKNIPQGLEDYREYLQHTNNVKWLNWQISGNLYLDIADKCPYCTSNILKKKEKITKVSEEFNAKSVEHLNNILNTIQNLEKYFSEDTNVRINEIVKNISGLDKVQIAYLIEIKDQIILLKGKLLDLRSIGFNSLKEVDKVVELLKSYKIDLSYFSHLNSKYTQEKISQINISVDKILEKAGILQGKVNIQKNNIRDTIQKHQEEINSFLKYAGYDYIVSIESDQNQSYKMKLKHKDHNSIITRDKTPLSYGERNAFALVLFMYYAIKENPDLIILDDPISSFDGNKKFAILNMLFMGNICLKNKTVLMLTHEFNSVIDTIYNLPGQINPPPTAMFLENNKGNLIEKPVSKNDIQSFNKIAKNNINSLQENINKIVYLRRLLEIEDSYGESYQLLSNLFHKREKPTFHLIDGNEREMTEEEIRVATEEIEQYIPGFDYSKEYLKVSNDKEMIKLYQNCKNNYEKLQLYRILKNGNHPNSVIKKFVNETYHIENDYLFQLNPCDYEIVPDYIIQECDNDLFS